MKEDLAAQAKAPKELLGSSHFRPSVDKTLVENIKDQVYNRIMRIRSDSNRKRTEWGDQIISRSNPSALMSFTTVWGNNEQIKSGLLVRSIAKVSGIERRNSVSLNGQT